ncbi:MAG TPA: ferredoxin family protein [Acidobacteriota bacterium]
MSSGVSSFLHIVVYEGAGSQTLPDSQRFQTVKALLERGHAVTCTGSRDGAVSSDGRPLLVLGHFGEQGIPDGAAVESEIPVFFRDIHGLGAAGVVEIVDAVLDESEAKKPGGWKPWFPVIDYDRCTNCMQCLSFCLFDVYSASAEGKIQVRNPQKCKTDCPACSRVCPEVAILFPKYKAGPINGDVVSEADLQREKMKIDISALLGGDIYALLRERSQRAQTRFARERDDERALKERRKCLEKLQAQVDIPPEVLMSLPSPDEIKFRAEKARLAAEEALQRQSTGPVSSISKGDAGE